MYVTKLGVGGISKPKKKELHNMDEFHKYNVEQHNPGMKNTCCGITLT